jgi:thiosulfate/3-mercaptopyruvate sulfurtransferase
VNKGKSWGICMVGLVSLALILAACGAESAPTGGATPGSTVPTTGANTGTLPPHTPGSLAGTPGAAGSRVPAGAASYLISAADLKTLIDQDHPRLRIVDMGSGDEYAAGHIPGAIHIDWSELNVTDTGAPSIAAWQKQVADLLGKRGIGADNRVIVYDHGTLYGARLWWVLDQLGHTKKQILDGGFPAWQAAGGAATKDAGTYPPVTYTAHPQPAVLAAESDVRAALGQAGIRLVDARSPGEYSGQDRTGATHDGHIPGAVNVPFTTTAAAGTPHLFKSPDELRALFAAQGVTPDQQVIAYCSTGVRSAVDYVALRLAGFTNVRLYTGSWAEWGNDPSAPAEK